jgi:bifunctional DNA-binding transcriptional regulator/antitoxin component of YhaV-PrlF toxin-antitoxin module
MTEKGEEEKSFVARVQAGYRIQIPDPLRILMGINEGDLVEIKIKKAKPPPEEKMEQKSTEKTT